MRKSPNHLGIWSIKTSDSLILYVGGEIGPASKDRVEHEIEMALQEPHKVVLDLRQTTCPDSTALKILETCSRLCRNRAYPMAIVCSPRLRTLVNARNLDEVLAVDSREAALAVLRARRDDRREATANE